MQFTEAVRSCLLNYVTFSGRARRSEYWYFVLFSVLGNIALSLIDRRLLGSGMESTQTLSSLFSLAIFLPTISVAVRRLHDVGRSGWWWWLWMIPMIGWIVLLVWNVSKGNDGPNEYGDDPFDGDQDGGQDSYSRKSSIPRVAPKD